ncbi:MAG: BLUF domain-containing protein [Pseudomonadota bacterium]
MKQLLYCSRAVKPLSEDAIEDLLVQSRQRNRLIDVTGLLLYGHNRFMQVLEGPEAAVTQLYKKIEYDCRHAEVIKLYEGYCDLRSYKNWSMAYRPMEAPPTGLDKAFIEVRGILDKASPKKKFVRIAPIIRNFYDDALGYAEAESNNIH